MSAIVLNGSLMKNKKAAFRYLKNALSLPDYFGNNLDALYDCLMDLGPVELQLANPQALIFALGTYGIRMLQVFFEVKRQKPDFQFSLIKAA